MIDSILIIYFMLSWFLTGLHFNEVKSEFNSNVTIVVAFVSVFISPIWYLCFLIIEFKNYLNLGVWYKYYTDKDYGKNFNYDTIYFIKNNKPKHILEKILRKKLLDRYDITNKNK